MGNLFGTDGIRGVANEELTVELCFKVARAVSEVLVKDEEYRPMVFIGADTRISGDMIQSALAAGFSECGVNVQFLGVLPTPAVAYLTNQLGADAGVMISASHNSFEYNGIKIFSKDGYKLPDNVEEEMERHILAEAFKSERLTHDKLGRIADNYKAVEGYIKYLTSVINTDLSGLKVCIDCANGSATATAKKLFVGLGAECVFLSNEPNGVNINDNCGSTHLDNLKAAVLEHKADIGLAFDGDADRCLAIDEKGNLIDGDQMIAIFAQYMRAQGMLKDDTAVVTVMSNLGFFEFAKNNNINTQITKVGDRYVLENMVENGYNLGGEQSGHIILSDYMTTGDGQLAGGLLLKILKESKKKASELAKVMTVYPQVLQNVTVPNKFKTVVMNDKQVKEIMIVWEEKLADQGRILVRPSGTEPLVRVMVEGKNIEEINACAKEVAQVLTERLKACE